MVRKLFFIFFLYFGNSVWSQFSNIPGTPIIKNFTEEEVNNNLTIFDISQSWTAVRGRIPGAQEPGGKTTLQHHGRCLLARRTHH